MIKKLIAKILMLLIIKCESNSKKNNINLIGQALIFWQNNFLNKNIYFNLGCGIEKIIEKNSSPAGFGIVGFNFFIKEVFLSTLFLISQDERAIMIKMIPDHEVLKIKIGISFSVSNKKTVVGFVIQKKAHDFIFEAITGPIFFLEDKKKVISEQNNLDPKNKLKTFTNKKTNFQTLGNKTLNLTKEDVMNKDNIKSFYEEEKSSDNDTAAEESTIDSEYHTMENIKAHIPERILKIVGNTEIFSQKRIQKDCFNKALENENNQLKAYINIDDQNTLNKDSLPKTQKLIKKEINKKDNINNFSEEQDSLEEILNSKESIIDNEKCTTDTENIKSSILQEGSKVVPNISQSQTQKNDHEIVVENENNQSILLPHSQEVLNKLKMFANKKINLYFSQNNIPILTEQDILNVFAKYAEKSIIDNLENETLKQQQTFLYEDIKETEESTIDNLSIENENNELISVNSQNIKKRIEAWLDINEVSYINMHLQTDDILIFNPTCMDIENIIEKNIRKNLESPIFSMYLNLYPKIILPILIKNHYITCYIENQILTILDSLEIQNNSNSCGFFVPTYAILGVKGKVQEYQNATKEEKQNIIKSIINITSDKGKSFGNLVAEKIIELLEKAEKNSEEKNSNNILDHI